MKRTTTREVERKMVPDEDCKMMIRLHMDGMSRAEIARKFERGESFVKGIVTGVNRGHLLAEVEREMA